MRQTLMISATLAIASTTTANTITVCPDGTCDFTSVTTAVNASQPGDLIEISAGTYLLGSTIDTDGKAITVRGELDDLGNPATRLDGQGTRRVLRCQDGETLSTVFENLAFVNGESSAGAGIRINHSGPTFINCLVEGSVDGGGVYLYNARPSFIDCTIRNNHDDWSGGGFSIYDNSNPILVNTVICSNTAKYDAQLSLDQGSTWTDDGDNCISDDCGDCASGPSADLNGDGVVDGADFGLMLSLWGSPGIADLNGDGTTDGSDIGLLLVEWS